MIKKLAVIIITAFAVTLGLNKYFDWFFDRSMSAMEAHAHDVITAPYTPVQPIERNKAIEITIEPVKPVYEGVALSDDLIDYLTLRCEVYAVDPALAMALMKSESKGTWLYGDWDDDLQRYRSVGFFQIRDVNWGWLYDDVGIDANTEKGNIDAGLYMLSRLLYKADDNIELALTMYKCGEYRGREIHDAGIVLDCVQEVMTDYENYKEANKK